MRCALHKEILYLDKEIENIETLRDINNKKIKCTKSYYINNTKLLLDYFIKNNYPSLKVAWYSGQESLIDGFEKVLPYFEYIKLGPYKQECGGLDNPNTNQKLFGIVNVDGFYRMIDITYKFWKTKQ